MLDIEVSGLQQNERVSHKGFLKTGEAFVIIESGYDIKTTKVFFQKYGKKPTTSKVFSAERNLSAYGVITIQTQRGMFTFPGQEPTKRIGSGPRFWVGRKSSVISLCSIWGRVFPPFF